MVLEAIRIKFVLKKTCIKHENNVKMQIFIVKNDCNYSTFILFYIFYMYNVYTIIFSQ